ncbi:MAG: hypothetical protein DLM60_03720 [Pseudonocardiales bacterium]|nr:MAG: hypothetical protein DLM60_03720 [Pseudonocardiales bacterium]
MQRLAPEVAVEVAKRLLTCDWSWTTADLDKALEAAGLTALEPLEGMSIRIEHAALPGVPGYVANLTADEKTVLDISVTLTELIDEADADALAALDAAYKEYEAALEEEFDEPDDRPDEKRAMWDQCDRVLELLNLDIGVVLAVVNKASRRRQEGDGYPALFGAPPSPCTGPTWPAIEELMADCPVSHSERAATGSGDGEWEDLASGLGRVLASLADTDVVFFLLDDVLVLAVSRDYRDVWLLGTGPEDQAEPVELSVVQKGTLAAIGFRPPLRDEAERSARDNWWFRLGLPADPHLLEAAGHMLVAAARQVYGADRPSAIVWVSMGLSADARRVLDSLGLTKSELERD